jgi:hypothetical protein
VIVPQICDHGVYTSGARIVPGVAAVAMVLALIGNLYPVPQGPYGKLPYIDLIYLAAELGWFFWTVREEEIGVKCWSAR